MGIYLKSKEKTVVLDLESLIQTSKERLDEKLESELNYDEKQKGKIQNFPVSAQFHQLRTCFRYFIPWKPCSAQNKLGTIRRSNQNIFRNFARRALSPLTLHHNRIFS